MSTATVECRDLDADLAICEAATAGPWNKEGTEVWKRGTGYNISEDGHVWVCDAFSVENAAFIASARQGWPYSIRRAQEAERENDRLRDEINLLQEQLNQHHRSHCYD